MKCLRRFSAREVVVELIAPTITKESLRVTALSDSQTYPAGTKGTDEELAALLRDAFHGEWNYAIFSHVSFSSGQLM